MSNSLRNAFCLDIESKKRFDEMTAKLTQEMIDNHSCYYCKHADLRDEYVHSYYTGKVPWCTFGGRNELKLHDDQMCLFWEYCNHYNDGEN